MTPEIQGCKYSKWGRSAANAFRVGPRGAEVIRGGAVNARVSTGPRRRPRRGSPRGPSLCLGCYNVTVHVYGTAGTQRGTPSPSSFQRPHCHSRESGNPETGGSELCSFPGFPLSRERRRENLIDRALGNLLLDSRVRGKDGKSVFSCIQCDRDHARPAL